MQFSADEPIDCVIGLGSNLGDRREHLTFAVRGVAELGRVERVSALYESPPLGPPQPDYLNAALRLRTGCRPDELLAGLLALERRAGRERGTRWGPRTLDLDILWISGQSIHEPGLVVPHPGLIHRAFALLPLLDVAPEATDPRTAASYAAMALTVDRTGVRRVAAGSAGWLE